MGPKLDSDLLGGGVLILFGLFVALYSTGHYQFGSLSDMGPGMFPGILGYILAGLGLIVFVPAIWRRTPMPPVELRPLIAICAAMAVFALGINRFGIAPTIVAVTGVSMLAGSDSSVRSFVAVATFLATITVLIFNVGLGLPVSIANWPFQ